MNIHHLELFYYAAKHGGISEAVRHMPYGIQQPALSSQLIQLERSLGVPLFKRRPFELTPEGRELFVFVQPFFENIEAVANRLRSSVSQHVRIGASETILQSYLPPVLRGIQKRFPRIRVTLRQGYHAALLSFLQKDEIDLAVTILDGATPAGMKSARLLQLPLSLLAPVSSPIKAPEELWKQREIKQTLISLPETEAISKSFHDQLRKLKVRWPQRLEVSSLKLVETYVEQGQGIGLSVVMPGGKQAAVRELVLSTFKPMTLGALWRHPASQTIETCLEEITRSAESIRSTSERRIHPAA